MSQLNCAETAGVAHAPTYPPELQPLADARYGLAESVNLCDDYLETRTALDRLRQDGATVSYLYLTVRIETPEGELSSQSVVAELSDLATDDDDAALIEQRIRYLAIELAARRLNALEGKLLERGLPIPPIPSEASA